jgi:uncharacterized protein YhbP (UPF0306 family)
MASGRVAGNTCRAVKKFPRLARIVLRDAAGQAVDIRGDIEVVLARSVRRVLEENVLCSIATVTSPGRAHINAAHFCWSTDLVLYFLSHPNAQHSLNLRKNASVAATVFSSTQRWGEPGRGVQLFGTSRLARGLHLVEAERLYARRYPAYRAWKATSSGKTGSEYRFYRVQVDRVKVMDEAVIGDGIFASAVIRRSNA